MFRCLKLEAPANPVTPLVLSDMQRRDVSIVIGQEREVCSVCSSWADA
jgi:hypothetical protein